MDFVSCLLAAVLSFTGLIAGVVLAFLSPEEMPTGRKFFPLLQRIALVAIAAVFISLYIQAWYLRLLLYIAAILILALPLRSEVVFPILAFPFCFSMHAREAFLAISVLIFLYGLPSGSLYAIGKERFAAFKSILPNVSFIILAIALYFIQAA
jgi:hypothetical protein